MLDHGRHRPVPVEQLELEEGWSLVTPLPRAVESPVVAAVVETDARVVQAHQHVALVEGIDRESFPALSAERAILGHANVRLAIPAELVRAPCGTRNLDPGRPEADLRRTPLERAGLV